MRHDVKIRRHGFKRAMETVCQYVCRWLNEREVPRSLVEIARRKSRHLLDDIGLNSMDDACRHDPACGDQRHRFWML